MPVTKVFILLLREGRIQSIILHLGSCSRERVSGLAGRLGSRFLRRSVAGGPNLLTHGGSWRNGPGALHGDASAAVLGPGDGAGHGEAEGCGRLFACGIPRVDD